MQKIKKLMRPIKIKCFINKFLRNLLTGLFLALTATALLMIASRLVVLTSLMTWIGIIVSTSGIAVFVISLIQKPTDYDVCKIVDTYGMNQRLLSFLSITKDNPFYDLLKKDVINTFESIDFMQKYKVTIEWKKLMASLVMICIIGIVSFIETPTSIYTKEYNAFKRELKEKIKVVELAEQEVIKNKVIEQQMKEELEKQLKDLKNAVKKNQHDDIKKESFKTMKKIDKVEQGLKKDLLMQQQGVASKKEVFENKSFSEIKDMQNLSEDMLESIENVEQSFSEMNINESLNKLSDAVSDVDDKIEDDHEFCDLKEGGTWSGSNSSDKSAQGDNSSSGNSSQSQGKSTSGESTQSQGNGQGSSSNNQGQTSSGGGSKRGQGSQTNAAKEESFDSKEKAIKASSDLSNTRIKNKVKVKSLTSNVGEWKDYGEVFDMYSDEKSKVIKSPNIPHEMKSIIKKYFEDIKE